MPHGSRRLLAWFLIVPGFFLFLTPLPIGLAMMTGGFVLLYSASPGFRKRTRWLELKFPRTAKRIRKMFEIE